jgi:hypothetical protein
MQYGKQKGDRLEQEIEWLGVEVLSIATVILISNQDGEVKKVTEQTLRAQWRIFDSDKFKKFVDSRTNFFRKRGYSVETLDMTNYYAFIYSKHATRWRKSTKSEVVYKKEE